MNEPTNNIKDEDIQHDIKVVDDMFYAEGKDPDICSETYDAVMASMVENHDVDGPGQLPNPTKRKRGRPEKVSKEVFAEVWNQCNNLREVAEVLGVPPMSASVKASNMRKAGCNLKLYKRGAKRKLSCAS